MKYNIFLLVALFLLSSCGDFFEESSQDEIRPTTVEDLTSVLYAEGYPQSTTEDAFLVLLTDEVQSNGLNNDSYTARFNSGQFIYCFDPEMFDGIKTFPNEANAWKNYYDRIKGCNVVLDYVNEMTGSDENKNDLIGQARLLRAYYYFRLTYIYCQPWQNGSPDQNLGVPLIKSSHVSDEQPVRNTLRETYDFIESELIQAGKELANFKPTTKYRVTKTVADILLARLYLYKEEWNKAIEYATTAIKEGPQLTNFTQLRAAYRNVYDVANSTEVVWNYGGIIYNNTTFFGLYSQLYSGAAPYSGAAHIPGMYDATNDVRRQYTYVYTSTSGNYYPKRSSGGSANDGEHGVRMGEVYLIRAEAYARTGNTAQALNDINTLRESRYFAGTYTQENITDATQLLNFILEERQRELVWEDGFRWMDIKRLGLGVTHTFMDENGGTTEYRLEPNSKLYALPIPQDAISKNKNLVQNPR